MTDDIRLLLLHLEDAICEHERAGAPSYTLLLIPHDARDAVHISRDGKPADISIALAIELAEHERQAGR